MPVGYALGYKFVAFFFSRIDMRVKIGIILLSSAVLATVAAASELFVGRQEWEPWKIDLQEGYCELQMWHRATKPPYYPDILFRFHVPIPWRDGRATNPDYPLGEMVLWLYSYLPNVPKENAPLHRIEFAVLDGKTIPRTTNDALNVRNDMYRFFETKSEDAMSILESFSRVHYLTGTVDLILTLSNGETVHKKVRPGHFFKTQARMLSICMQDGFMH
jgi:hypothetical protein